MPTPACQRLVRHAVYMLASVAMAGRYSALAGRCSAELWLYHYDAGLKPCTTFEKGRGI
ncbi:MAG: hypothetical protein KAU38_00290 [Desulfobacterales bacterium]|nr:hypothetical protein [Desulfobacterales bacterium]